MHDILSFVRKQNWGIKQCSVCMCVWCVCLLAIPAFGSIAKQSFQFFFNITTFNFCTWNMLNDSCTVCARTDMSVYVSECVWLKKTACYKLYSIHNRISGKQTGWEMRG